MGPFVERSAVVIARFPYSDLSQTSIRPAVVLANAGRGDWVLGQITRNPSGHDVAIELTDDSFAQGSIRSVSYFRPGKLFAGNESLITRAVARLKPEVFNQLIDAVVDLLNQNRIRR